MDPFLQDLAKGLTLVVALVFALRWAVSRIDAMDKERRAEALRLEGERLARETAERQRCESVISQLSQRVVFLENRAHNENRDERAVMLKSLELNAQAFSKLADRIPEPTPTPPNGNKKV